MDLPQHVLRFWETRFPQIRPLKRAGGRRYYRPDDVERLRLIKRLLYDEGYTIKGVQKLFKEQGAQAFASGALEARAARRRGVDSSPYCPAAQPRTTARSRKRGKPRRAGDDWPRRSFQSETVGQRLSRRSANASRTFAQAEQILLLARQAVA